MTITPHTRHLIQLAIDRGEIWHGERDGVKMQVARQMSLIEPGEISWRARSGKRTDGGQVETVFDACSAIETFSRRAN